MKKIVFTLFLTIFYVIGCSQKKETAKDFYSVEELQQDFKIFRSSLEEGHPALYRYTAKASMDSIFAVTLASIDRVMTDREFTLLLSGVVAQIRDGHSSVLPPKIRKDSLDERPTAIPFQPYWDSNKIFILRNFSSLSDDGFIGAQVISINGHSMEEFIKQMLNIFPSDGTNITHIYRRGLQTPRWFARYFYMLYGYTESYRLEYIPFNESVVKTIEMPGITFDSLWEVRQRRYASVMNAPPIEFTVSADRKYAILNIKTFDKEAFKDKKIKYENFLKTSFKKLEEDKINHLILDLRNNGGGTDEYGKILFSYFTSQPFDYYESIEMNKETYSFFKYTNNPDAQAPKGMLRPNNKGTFDNIKHPNVGKQMPSFPTFNKSIYVLIDGGCYSTASEFLSILHQNTRALFIGEEAGGGYYGNSSGPTIEFKVPNSKVAIEIPLMKYSMAVKGYPYLDKGLIPNYIISPSIKDKINNTDVVMEFAKSLIH